MAADRLDLLGDRAGAAPLGALERHVFEEMRDAVDRPAIRAVVPTSTHRPSETVSTVSMRSVTMRSPFGSVASLVVMSHPWIMAPPARSRRAWART